MPSFNLSLVWRHFYFMDKDIIKQAVIEAIEEMIPEKYRNKRYVRDWEITELKDGSEFGILSDGDFWLNKVGVKISADGIVNTTNMVKSIKRISDGEIFTVGDEIGLNWYTFSIPFYINRFTVDRIGRIYVLYDNTGSKWEIQFIRKTFINQNK